MKGTLSYFFLWEWHLLADLRLGDGDGGGDRKTKLQISVDLTITSWSKHQFFHFVPTDRSFHQLWAQKVSMSRETPFISLISIHHRAMVMKTTNNSRRICVLGWNGISCSHKTRTCTHQTISRPSSDRWKNSSVVHPYVRNWSRKVNGWAGKIFGCDSTTLLHNNVSAYLDYTWEKNMTIDLLAVDV